MQDVMRAEDKATYKDKALTRADRAYLLDLYAECLKAAKGDRKMVPGPRVVGVS
jgi:hypothetical protein